MERKTACFESRVTDGTLVIQILGEIDHHNAVAVRGDIDKRIYESGAKRLVMDLSAVDFMDSSGLGLIMGRYALISRLGGTLTVREPSSAIVKILKLAGFDRMISIEGKRIEGVK